MLTLVNVGQYSADFNLAAGTSSGAGSSITSVGNGWYRCTMTNAVLDTVNRSYVVRMNNGSEVTYTGDGSSGILICGAQLELASSATPYQKITNVTNDYLAAYPNAVLFQDSAGTTPVTAVEQPVGLMKDKSGRNNHAFQATAGNQIGRAHV